MFNKTPKDFSQDTYFEVIDDIEQRCKDIIAKCVMVRKVENYREGLVLLAQNALYDIEWAHGNMEYLQDSIEHDIDPDFEL